MNQLRNVLNYWNSEFSHKLIESEHIFNEIYDNCSNTFDKGCGSYLFDGQKYEYFVQLYAKQKLLYDVAKTCNSVLEIGTYIGHSALIMLLANPKMKLTTIDIMNHLSLPATETLKKYFPEADIQFIHGNSLDIIPTLKDKYDMFHIDGNHDVEYVVEEFCLCKNLSNSDIYRVVFDDWHGERGPGSSVEKFVMNTSKVIRYDVPDCLWTNSYFEIDLK